MTILHDFGSVLGWPLDTSFELPQFHGNSSWLMREVAFRAVFQQVGRGSGNLRKVCSPKAICHLKWFLAYKYTSKSKTYIFGRKLFKKKYKKYFKNSYGIHFHSKISNTNSYVPRLNLLICSCKFFLNCQTPKYVRILEVSTLDTLTLLALSDLKH